MILSYNPLFRISGKPQLSDTIYIDSQSAHRASTPQMQRITQHRTSYNRFTQRMFPSPLSQL